MHDLKDEVYRLFSDPCAGKCVSMVRMQMERVSECLYGKEKLWDTQTAAGIIKQIFAKADREVMAVMSVSCRMEPLAIEIVAVGGLDCCHIDIRSLFKHAILNNAGAVFCFHNHPGGDPTPGRDDQEATEKIRKAGELLEIRLVDHIIIGNGRYYSFHRNKVCSF